MRAPKQVPLDQLRQHPDNPRSISGSKLEALKRSLAEDPSMLEARPLIALPSGEVIAGNQRLAAARELGWTTIPTITVDLDPTKAKQWMLRDNNPYGDWEDDGLTALLESMEPDERALTGFSEDEIDRLLGEVGGGGTKLTDDQAAKYTQQYEEQYGVIILCADEAKQEEVFNELSEAGYEVRVVVT